MKQTLEEAAMEAAEDCYECRYDDSHTGMRIAKEAFIYGAEWQTRQSPWINVKERLPKDFKPKLILLKDGQVRIALLDSDYHPHNNEFEITYFWYDREADESFDLEDVIAWMSIPSFDEILEANRDVLERTKEKGD